MRGARHDRGTGLSLAQIRDNRGYGDVIVRKLSGVASLLTWRTPSPLPGAGPSGRPRGLPALGLRALLALPAQRHGWMPELDPGFAGPLPDDACGNRGIVVVVVLLLLLMAALRAQAVALLLLPRRGLRWLALGLLALVVWAWRFALDGCRVECRSAVGIACEMSGLANPIREIETSRQRPLGALVVPPESVAELPKMP